MALLMFAMVEITNAVYKHVHHDEWCQNLFVDKIKKLKKNFKFFSRHAMTKCNP
jgi:hypothetical protein